MEKEFEAWLISRGYRAATPSGHPSTARDYVNRIHKVCQWENCSWEELAERIDSTIALYGPGGTKEEQGNRSHRSVINALRRYREYCLQQVKQQSTGGKTI